MNGIISHSLIPIRIATLAGATLASISLLLSILYIVAKLINWQFQAPGATTTIVLILFFAGIQLFFLGLLGEYVGAIHGQVRRKPFVIIREAQSTSTIRRMIRVADFIARGLARVESGTSSS